MERIKRQMGQSAIEYLVFFSVIAVLTLLSVCAVYPQVKEAGDNAFKQVVDLILGESG